MSQLTAIQSIFKPLVAAIDREADRTEQARKSYYSDSRPVMCIDGSPMPDRYQRPRHVGAELAWLMGHAKPLTRTQAARLDALINHPNHPCVKLGLLANIDVQ